MKINRDAKDCRVNKDPNGRTLYYVACDALLMRDGKILLNKRANTSWMDGYWNLVGGHVEDLETIEECASRELREEVGIDVSPKDLEIVQCIQELSNRNTIQFYALCNYMGGVEPTIQPEIMPNGELLCKSSKLGWFDLDNLPENIVPVAKHAIEMFKNGQLFSRFGFDR